MIEGSSRTKISIRTKYITVFLIVLFCILLVTILMVACAFTTGTRTVDSDIFTIISHDEKLHCYIVYMNKTKVMYAVSDGSYSRGIFTVLVSEDGTPMKYKGE